MIDKKQNTKKNKTHVFEKTKRTKTGKQPNSSSTSKPQNSFYYSFLTIILSLCLIQITISAVLNISKIISYKTKIIQITKTRDAALALNEQLKNNIKNFSNVSGLEAIARNSLKMSSEDEVLVIINKNNPDSDSKTEPTKTRKWIFKQNSN